MNTAPTGREAVTMTVLIGSLAIFLVELAWHQGTDGFLSDDAVYLMMADYFSPYLDERLPHLEFLMRQSLFPPLYPLVLAMAGAGSEHSGLAHLLTTLLFVAALLVFLLWVRRESSSMPLAAVLTLIFALLPFSLVHVTEIWSESLYLLLLFAFLNLLPNDRGSTGSLSLPLAASFVVGLALLTRGAAVALLPVLLQQLWQTPGGERWRHLAVVLVLPLAWWLVERSLYPSVGYLGLLGDSLTAHDPVRFVTSILPEQAASLWRGWNTIVAGGSSRPAWVTWLAGMVFAAGLFGLLRRLFRPMRPDALFVAGHLVMLLLWSAPGHAARLLYPVVPLLLFYAVTVVGDATRPAGRRLRLALCLLPALALFPHSQAIIQRHLHAPADLADANFAHTRYWLDREEAATAQYDIERRTVLIRFLRSLPEEVPPESCVYSVHVPLVMLHARRTSRLYPTVKPGPGELESCRHALVINFAAYDFKPMVPLQELLGLDFEEVSSARDGRGNIVATLLRMPSG